MNKWLCSIVVFVQDNNLFHFRRVLSLYIILTITAACGFMTLYVHAAESNLFEPLSPTELLSQTQEATLSQIKIGKGKNTINIVRPNLDLLGSKSVNLNVAKGKVLKTENQKVETTNGFVTWSADLSSAGGDAIFIIKDSNITGTIRSDVETYQIRPIGAGLHVIIQLDSKSMPPDHPPSHK